MICLHTAAARCNDEVTCAVSMSQLAKSGKPGLLDVVAAPGALLVEPVGLRASRW